MEEGRLVTIAERKFSEFFKKPDRFESSDVIYKDGFLYVVFDNLYQFARIRADLDVNKEGATNCSGKVERRSLGTGEYSWQFSVTDGGSYEKQ